MVRKNQGRKELRARSKVVIAEPLHGPSKYTYRVTWSEEDGRYVGLSTEFPALSCFAVTRMAALHGVERLVENELVELRKSGDLPPEPLATRKFSGVFKVRIPFDLHRRLVMEAKECGVSLNRLVSMKLASG
jgi:predicted HicB family RNase H-like nuclease